LRVVVEVGAKVCRITGDYIQPLALNIKGFALAYSPPMENVWRKLAATHYCGHV